MTGTVIDLDTGTSDGDLVYYPVVRFMTAEGRTVEFTSSSGSSSPPAVGDSVEVLYDPDDPQEAQLSGFFSLWLWPIALGGIGIAAAAAGLWYPGTGPLARRRQRLRQRLESEDASRSHRLDDEDRNGLAV